MDYNWLENVPSSLTPVPVYQPDFGFLQSMQMKANQQYEQGFKEVKTAYSSLFNKKVTGEEATKRQQDYSKQALDQMKAIAATDLSDPKNVQIADDILAPFYEDKLYLQNIADTSHYQNEFAKQEAMKSAKTKEERELYNPVIDYYLGKGYEQLAKAPMTNEAYGKLERRKSIGIVNISEIAKKQISDVGYIKTVDANGNAMVITTNGPKSVEAYSSVYKSIAARPEYAEQNRVLSIARFEMETDQIRKDNPNLSQDQVNGLIADKAIAGNVKWYAGNIADYRKTAAEWRRKNIVYMDLDENGYPKDGVGKPLSIEDQQNIEYNLSQAKAFEEQAKKTEELFTKEFGYVQTDPTKFSTNIEDYIKAVDPNSDLYKKRVLDITTNTKDYIQNVYLSQDADAFAKGLANLSSIEIKVNPVQQEVNKQVADAFKQQMDLLKTEAGIAQKQEEIDIKLLQAKAKAGTLSQEDLDKYYGQGFTMKGVGAFASQSGIDVGSGDVYMTGTNVRKVSTIDSINLAKLKLASDINRESFGADGMMNMASEDIVPNGLNGPEILTLSGAYNNYLATGKYDNSSLAEREKIANVLNSLPENKDKKFTADSHPNDIREALGNMARTDAADPLFKTVNPEKQSLVMKMALQNQVIQKNSAELLKLNGDYQKKLQDFVDADTKGEFSKLIKTTIDPKTGEKTYDIITAKDMASSFPSLTVKDKEKGEITFTPEQVAEMWKNKTIGELFKDQGSHIVGVNKKRIEDFKHFMPSMNRDELMKEWHKYIYGTYKNPATGGSGLDYVTVIRDNSHRWDNVPPDPNTPAAKYGSPDEIQNKLNTLSSKVVANLPQFATGESSPELTFDLSGTDKQEIDPVQKKTGEAIIKTMQSPINRKNMYIVDGSNKQVENGIDTDIEKAITDAKFKDFIYDIAGSVTYIPLGPNGVPAIRISTQLGKGDKDNETIGGVSVAKIKSLGTIYMDVADNAKSEVLQQLPRPETLYRYGQLLTNPKGIIQDDFEKANGFVYTIQPDPNSKNEKGLFTKIRVYTSQWQVDEKTGQFIMENGKPKSTPQATAVFNVGEGGYSIDHICEDMKNNWILGEMQKRRMLLDANKNKPSSSNTQTFGDIYKKFGFQQ